MSATHECTTLVLGSGIAGLTYALKTARFGDVIILTKKDRAESNTNYAQGGVAAVTDPTDSFELHVKDTLGAGGGLCRRAAVELVIPYHDGSAAVSRAFGIVPLVVVRRMGVRDQNGRAACGGQFGEGGRSRATDN